MTLNLSMTIAWYRLVQDALGMKFTKLSTRRDGSSSVVLHSDRGVGIAGYLLGGGYSMKTNQYGPGIDNVTEFEVASPNGYRVTAIKNNNKELFEALRVRFSLTMIEPRSREVGITLAS
jgi:FAD/FMN-containing dehydrogenase